ncbi:hypothetical protein B0H21DRAFT_578742 [Amylocystis lapponica]|nr:hypothetical protein B0H21DRAFT_578742 [Amylocystis lapponica]
MERPRTMADTPELPNVAAIEKLSSECLVRVFQACNEIDEDMRWLKFANTCRRLREVAITAPSLWNKINVKRGLEFLQACLQRSGNTKLDLYFRVLRPEGPAVPDVMGALQPHAQRIRKLHIVTDKEPSMKTILSHLTFSLSSVEVLALITTIDDDATWNKDLFTFTRAQLPLLHSLELHRVPIPWTSTVLTGLRSLSLERFEPKHGLTLNTILDIVQRNPILEHLTITAFDPSILDDRPAHAPTLPVPLLNLRELHLKDTPAILARFLGLLRISAGTSVILEPILNNYNGLRGTFSAALPPDQSKVPVLATIRSISLSVDTFNLELECASADPDTHDPAVPVHVFESSAFSMEPQDEAALFADALADLAAVFADAPVAELALDANHDYVSKKHWRAVLSAFPHLVHLRAAGLRGDEPLTPLFQALREPPMRTTRGVLCPRLATLEVSRGWENVETKSVGVLQKTLAHRAAEGARLRTLALYCCPPAVLNARWLDKLRAVAGEVTMEKEENYRVTPLFKC